MGQGFSMLGFVVIVILYAVIGLMAAAGAILIARKLLAPKIVDLVWPERDRSEGGHCNTPTVGIGWSPRVLAGLTSLKCISQDDITREWPK
jgi:hypothetical protein